MFGEMRPQRLSCTGNSVNLLPASWEENARTTPCKQLRAAALAWSWVNLSQWVSRCLGVLGHAKIALAGSNAYALLWTEESCVWVTQSTAVRVPMPILLSTGSRMRC